MNLNQIQNKLMSEESYFGVDNSLHTGMVSAIDAMKAKTKDIIAKNPKIRNSELIKQIDPEIKRFTGVISEELNISGVALGFDATLSCSCYDMLLFSKILGKDNSGKIKKLRLKFEDVIENKNGYKFKDGKGVYFALILGIHFIKSDSYTSEEVAALMSHELGHAMAHIVNGFNTYVSQSYISNMLSGNLSISSSGRKYWLTKWYNTKEDDETAMRNLANEMLDETEVDEYYDYSSWTTEKTTTNLSKSKRIDIDNNFDYDKDPKKKNIIFRIIDKLVGAITSVLLFWWFIPSILYLRSSMDRKSKSTSVKCEEIADTFAVAYGFGPALSTALKKMTTTFDKLDNTLGGGLINKIPILDLYNSTIQMQSDYFNAAFGYPSDAQRVANNYSAAKFELDNNKDLTVEQRKELESQLLEYKSIYDEYVNDKKKKGFFYRIFSTACRKSIEEAAEKNPIIKEHVLEPLKKQSVIMKNR